MKERKRTLKGVSLGFLVAGVAAPSLLAQWDYDVSVDSTHYGVSQSSSGGPPSASTETAGLGNNGGLSTMPPATGNPYMTSSANTAGEAALGVEAIFSDLPDTPRDATATAKISQTVTVQLGPDQSFNYDFSIPNIYLLTAGQAGSFEAGAPVVAYEIDIRLDGSSIWHSGATLSGGFDGRVLNQNGVALATSLVGVLTDFEAGYVFSPFSGSLPLGTFSGGQNFTVETTLTASLAAGPYELGGLALIGDPANLGSSVFSGTISAVPEPQTYALIAGMGLLGFGVARRFRR